MGHGRWSDDDWTSYSKSTSSMSRDALYSRRSADDSFKSGQNLNAKVIKFREARDSKENPCSTPVMVGLDVTGSMGFIAEHIAKEGLGSFVGHILQRRPVVDPHLLFMGIGDAVTNPPDRAPLQATQFEADNRICQQLTDIWLEKGGGGNTFESYDLAWAFAAYRTHTDAWDKRKAKGYLFTAGDEMFPQGSSESYVKSILDGNCPQVITPESLLAAAAERYHVFHIIVAEGDFASRNVERVEKSWQKHLGLRALTLIDHKHIAEVMVSAIAVSEGKDVDDVIKSWPDKASKVVARALLGKGQ